jgi:Spy/CpxP family protein refolding chaperone
VALARGTAATVVAAPANEDGFPLDSCDVGARLEQRREALQQANLVREARAKLKGRIASGELSAADVVVSSRWELNSMPIEKLLASQRGWGKGRCSEFLTRMQIRETKTIGSMTERQRALVSAVLNSVQR